MVSRSDLHSKAVDTYAQPHAQASEAGQFAEGNPQLRSVAEHQNELTDLVDILQDWHEFAEYSNDIGCNEKLIELPVYEEMVLVYMPLVVDEANVNVDWVPDNFEKFCRGFLKLSTGASKMGTTNFNPFDFQVAIAEAVENHTTTGIYKSRQQGISELSIAYILWKMLGSGKGEKGFSCIVFSKSQEDAKILGDRMISMASGLGDLCPAWAIDAATHRRFVGGYGDVKFLPTNRGRGMTGINLVVIDECDFIPDIDSLLAGVLPTLSISGGKMLQITTPNGVGGLLYRLIEAVDLEGFERVTSGYRQRTKGDTSDNFWHRFSDGDRCFFTVHWRANPMLDEAWAVAYKQANNISDLIWEIEFEISPAVGGCRLVAQEYIDAAIIDSDILDDIRRMQCVVAGLDTNAGTIDNDYTSLSPVYQEGTRDMFYIRLSYYNNTEDHPTQIESIVDELFKHRPQRMIIESNNAGTIFHTYLKEEYPLGERMEAIFTTGNRKEMAIQTLVYLLQAGRLRIERGHPLLKELPYLEMVVKNNHRTYGAREGYHDDAVMSSAIAIGVLRQEHGLFRGGLEQLKFNVSSNNPATPKPVAPDNLAHLANELAVTGRREEGVLSGLVSMPFR